MELIATKMTGQHNMAAHKASQQAPVNTVNVACAAWANLAQAAQHTAGAQPPAHVIAAFVQQVPALRMLRIDAERDWLVADLVITTLCTGAVQAALYKLLPLTVAAVKLTAGHAAALQAIEGALRAAVQGHTAVQAHPTVINLLTGAILANWHTATQGYTALQPRWQKWGLQPSR
jgi:hypothetical protein